MSAYTRRSADWLANRSGSEQAQRAPGMPTGSRGADRERSTVPVCRECHDRAAPRPPKVWRAVLTPRPDWSHTDGTPLCPVPNPGRVDHWGPYASEPEFVDDSGETS
ncbi:hypothetical protein LHJ74_21070 [Streptomyces sp. N2-109]|uniref:PRL2-8 n=1 Tax=Streptomyces gossypii TaxID=2883101 RepID=A0ABT2JWU0_9ACTN|nr:hypothetical protein [Streptomyces gossypii]MCT2592365.1 hypothetical protein [Streptomyces gossypii]